MTAKYKDLDAAILECIKGCINTSGLMLEINSAARQQAFKLQTEDVKHGKPAYRYISARLQALRKAGKIRYVGGIWLLVEVAQ